MQYTIQTAFNTMVSWLRSQGGKSQNDTDHGRPECVMISSDGKRCAVGTLLPDSMVDEYTGACVAADMLDGEPAWTDQFEDWEHRQPDYSSLFGDMMSVHDTSEVEDWETEFQMVADIHSLTYHPPVNLTFVLPAPAEKELVVA